MTNNERNKTTKSRKIRKLGEKENYKYLEILEADIIKQVERQENIKKEVNEKITWNQIIL